VAHGFKGVEEEDEDEDEDEVVDEEERSPYHHELNAAWASKMADEMAL
jgi:hypothetical protein